MRCGHCGSDLGAVVPFADLFLCIACRTFFCLECSEESGGFTECPHPPESERPIISSDPA